MTDKRKAAARWAAGSVAGFLVSAASVAGLLVDAGDGLLVGILFWGGLAAGLAGFLASWRTIRTEAGYREFAGKSAPGWRTFFSSRAAGTADLVCVISWIVVVLAAVKWVLPGMVTVIGIAAGLFSFYMHFVLNGRVFRYITGTRKTRKQNEEGA